MILRRTTLALLPLLLACNTQVEYIQKSDDVKSALSASNLSDEELKAAAEDYEKETKERELAFIASSTSIDFDKLKHDFGDVLPDSDNTTEFIVYNTGDKPLILDDVSASCGCTMPQKPEGPIAPGESDVIEVTFHPKPGQVNEIKKTITVTANTEKKVHMLEIRAFVTK
ncbi:MAG: DUF1573 domain-containing protein [Flavobacteriales bacterium]|nr:DUF1573 domain-containing protein [Flavobacteriales bacterium]